VLAHLERRKQDRMDQPATMRARFAPGNYPGPKPGPGVFATSSSVATPARLPDGALTERSVPEILPTRELTASETTLKGTEK
jgi:NADH-quinone oxidoreductase subunit J